MNCLMQTMESSGFFMAFNVLLQHTLYTTYILYVRQISYHVRTTQCSHPSFCLLHLNCLDHVSLHVMISSDDVAYYAQFNTLKLIKPTSKTLQPSDLCQRLSFCFHIYLHRSQTDHCQSCTRHKRSFYPSSGILVKGSSGIFVER